MSLLFMGLTVLPSPRASPHAPLRCFLFARAAMPCRPAPTAAGRAPCWSTGPPLLFFLCRPPSWTPPPSLLTCVPELPPPPLHPLPRHKGHRCPPLFDSPVHDTPCPSNDASRVTEHPIPIFHVLGDQSCFPAPESTKKAPPRPLYSEPLPVRHSSSIGPVLHPFRLSLYCKSPPVPLSTVVWSSTPSNTVSSSQNRRLTITPQLGDLRCLLSLLVTLPVRHRCRGHRPRRTFPSGVPSLAAPLSDPGARSSVGSASSACHWPCPRGPVLAVAGPAPEAMG
jgi:hypothetical protein